MDRFPGFLERTHDLSEWTTGYVQGRKKGSELSIDTIAATTRRADASKGSQPVIDYTYLADGKVDHADYRNGVHSAYGYDGRGMTNSIQYTRGDGANLSSRTYWRDERDRITAYQKSTQNSVNPMENGRGDHYWYDGEGQLTDAYYNAVDPANNPQGPLRIEHFEYDQLGNRHRNPVNSGNHSQGWCQRGLEK